MLLLLRSLAFQAVFLGFGTLLALYSLIPLARGDRAQLFAINALWARGINRLLRAIAGIHVRIEGLEQIPAGPVIIAAKHQSLWDTTIIFHLFGTPAVVMKQELLKIPIYGALCRGQGMIVVDREGGAKALKKMLADARAAAAEGRRIVIFPQGTRTRPGEPAPYQPGVAALYRDLKLPVVPAVVNSGCFWPKRGWRRPPGTIVLRFLAPIPPGLHRDDFMQALETRIETAQAELEAETRTGPARG